MTAIDSPKFKPEMEGSQVTSPRFHVGPSDRS